MLKGSNNGKHLHRQEPARLLIAILVALLSLAQPAKAWDISEFFRFLAFGQVAAHTPGGNWQATIDVNCITQLGGGDCDAHLTNWAVFVFTGPALPNDAPCLCWHHIMVSIDTLGPSGAYELDGTTGTLSESTTSTGSNFVGPGGTIQYSQANYWLLGPNYNGDLAELYINTTTLFDVTTQDRGVFTLYDVAAKGLGNASALRLPAHCRQDRSPRYASGETRTGSLFRRISRDS